ncbi:hypothetical protein KHQ82_05325 [Mycoplasmatota bacterium]|nr:hypothetical protein KHQ82_05325 [Mycoplasmatota bacterium]
MVRIPSESIVSQVTSTDDKSNVLSASDIISGLKDLIDDRKSSITNYEVESDNIYKYDIEVLSDAIKIIENSLVIQCFLSEIKALLNVTGVNSKGQAIKRIEKFLKRFN